MSPSPALLPLLARLAVLTVLAAGAWSRTAFPATAQGALSITAAPAADYDFGQTLTFTVGARSADRVTGATVFYRTLSAPRTVVGAAHFEPARDVSARYTVDLKARPLPPFGQVEYWWELRDGAGRVLTTSPQTITYLDDRFEWQSRRQGPVTVYWHAGDRAFGQMALDVALAGLAADGGLPEATGDTSVFIYARDEDLRSALQTVGQAWAGGHAHPALGVVLVPVAPGLEAQTAMQRLIPHELTHLRVYAAVGGEAGYARVPRWLDEGLAGASELQPDPDLPAVLAGARDGGRLLPLAGLCGSFPDKSAEAQLAYAQSASIVRFIREAFGTERLRQLLAAYADGAVCETGVERGLGVTLDDLERAWLQSAVRANPALLRLRGLAPWMLIAGLLLLPVGVFVLVARPPRGRKAGTGMV